MENMNLEDLIAFGGEIESDNSDLGGEDQFQNDDLDVTNSDDNDSGEGQDDGDDSQTLDQSAQTAGTDTSTTSSQSQETTEGENSDSPLNTYYSILEDKGLLYVNDDFKFDGTAESLESALDQTRENLQKAVFSAFFDRLPEEWRPALEYAIHGGTDIEKYLSTFSTKKLEDLDIKGSTEDQRAVLREYYKRTTKYDDSKIEKFIDRLHATGELEEEALNTYEELLELSQKERQQLAEDQKRQAAEQENLFKQRRASIASAIKESSIPGDRKPKLEAFIFNTIQTSRDEAPETQINRVLNNIANNEKHYVQLAEVLFDCYDPKTGFNFDKFIKRGATKNAQDVKNKLEALANSKTLKGSSGLKPNTNDFNLE